MRTTIAIFLFILWLLGTVGVYSIGWAYHILLIASVMIFFVAALRNKKLEVNEIIDNTGLSQKEAEQVKRIMNKNRLHEQEAVELLNMRLNPNPLDNKELLQTEVKKIRQIMNKHRLSQQEAVELLSFRLRLHR